MGLPEGALTQKHVDTLRSLRDGVADLDDTTMSAVVDEFAALIDGGTGKIALPAPSPGPALQTSIEPATLPKLPVLPSEGANEGSDSEALGGADPWERVIAQENEKLVGVLLAEAPEVGAVLLSKVKVSRAAELLGSLPGPLARRITYCVSLISEISPEAVRRIGAALAATFSEEPARAFSDGPVERVGAILNFSRSVTRDDVLAGLDEADPEFADAVRKSIFTFANIPARVVPRDIPKIMRGIEQADLIIALVAAKESDDLQKSADFILGAMPQRMADTLRDEMTEAGEVKTADGEVAMAKITAAIREMDEAGEIFLVVEDE